MTGSKRFTSNSRKNIGMQFIINSLFSLMSRVVVCVLFFMGTSNLLVLELLLFIIVTAEFVLSLRDPLVRECAPCALIQHFWRSLTQVSFSLLNGSGLNILSIYSVDSSGIPSILSIYQLVGSGLLIGRGLVAVV